jgi:glutamate racemase
LLVPVLRRLLPDGIRLVDSATTCAEHLKQELLRLDMINEQESEGTLEILLTDLSEEFEALARRFLRKPSGRIQRAVLS